MNIPEKALYLSKTGCMFQPNPFLITADYCGPEYFCDRIEETRMLEENILNGRNTALISTRRMGKSGLIAHTFSRELVKTHFKTFSIDLYPTSSLEEMILLLAKEITTPLKSTGEKILKSFLSVVRSLRPGFKADPVTGQFVFDLSLGDIVRPQDSLEEIFDYLERSETPCLVSIDEFQQIAEYPEKNVIELLRTRVQKCKHTWFIFSGSDRRMMEKIFNNPSGPFYLSCSLLYLDPIKYDSYLPFARRHFEQAGKSIEDACFKGIYTLFEGHTWYVQRLLNELYAWTRPGETAKEDMLPEVLTYVVKTYARTFQEQLSNMPDAQKKLLIAVAKDGKSDKITSIDFCRKHAMKSPSTVQSALRVLHEKGVLKKEGGSYSVANRLLEIWVKMEY